MLGNVISRDTIPEVIAELEQLSAAASDVSLGAIYVLKNELEPLPRDSPRRRLEIDRTYVLPSSVLATFTHERRRVGLGAALRWWLSSRWAWLRGVDATHFRDRCDRAFWREVVPDVTASFGVMADVVLNTINEAIINYAEYSFGPWAVWRRIHIRLFKTEGDLVYAIIRPSGHRLRSFDPLALKTREIAPAKLLKRGWGHTLIMERALFLSFDHEPRRRGMLVILGPDSR